MATIIPWNDGSTGDDVFAPVRGPKGSVPKADVLPIVPGETVGSMAQRAYGANTAQYRSRIEHANEHLDGALMGEIRAPR